CRSKGGPSRLRYAGTMSHSGTAGPRVTPNATWGQDRLETRGQIVGGPQFSSSGSSVGSVFLAGFDFEESSIMLGSRSSPVMSARREYAARITEMGYI